METMGWLFEDEQERQAAMEDQLKDLDGGGKKKSDEVDEGDEEEPKKTATSVDVEEEETACICGIGWTHDRCLPIKHIVSHWAC